MNAITPAPWRQVWEALGQRFVAAQDDKNHAAPTGQLVEPVDIPHLTHEQFPKPRLILCISAHWVTSGTQVCSVNAPKTIHDFSGFPAALFALQYPAPGAPEFARTLATRLGCAVSEEWGLDHGAWGVLLPMFPLADRPVVQLSLNRKLSLEEHFLLGTKLADLRHEGVLIVASGNITHNLGMLGGAPEGAPPTAPDPRFPFATAFDGFVARAIESGNLQDLAHFESPKSPESPESPDTMGSFESAGQNNPTTPIARAARLAHPNFDHYWPLLYAAGAAQQAGLAKKAQWIAQGFDFGSLSMRSVLWH